MAKKFYYGFEYWDGRNTTTGQPNEKTGRYSIAGDMIAFTTKADIDSWVENGEYRYGKSNRVIVNKRELRRLALGMTVASFNQWVEYNEWEAEWQIQQL